MAAISPGRCVFVSFFLVFLLLFLPVHAFLSVGSTRIASFNYLLAQWPALDVKALIQQLDPIPMSTSTSIPEACKFRKLGVSSGPAIALLQWDNKTVMAGCVNYYHAISHLSSILPAKSVLVIVSPAHCDKYVAGAYGGDPYTSHDFRIADYPMPTLPTVIVSQKDYDRLLKSISMNTLNGSAAQVVIEAGPWNTIFLSPTYVITMWVLFGVVCCMIVFAFINIYRAHKADVLHWDLRNGVFFLGLISTFCNLC